MESKSFEKMVQTSNNPPPEESPVHILNCLNDDCIQAILFEIKDARDFLSAAETCTRFQRNAKEIFCLKWQKVVIYDNDNFVVSPTQNLTDWDYKTAVPNERLEIFFKIFENQVHSLVFRSFDNRKRDNTHLKTALNHCARLLVELTVDRLNFDLKEFPQLLALEKFTLQQGYAYNFESHSTLKSLTLRGCAIKYKIKRSLCDWFTREFPHLEEALFEYTNVKRADMNKFLILNPQLRKLRLKNCRNLKSTILRGIGNRAQNLQELSIDLNALAPNYGDPFADVNAIDFNAYKVDIMDVAELRNLKTLHMDCHFPIREDDLVDALIENNVQIEDLRMRTNENTQTMENFVKLKSLKKLHLNRVSNRLLIEYARNINSLEEMIAEDSDLIDAKGIMTALSHRKKLTSLTIGSDTIQFDAYTSNAILSLAKNQTKVKIYRRCEPYDIGIENCEWFELNFKRFYIP